jgi:transposase
MRGHVEPQGSMFSYFSPDSRVPTAHPLRSIKAYADQLLRGLSRQFEQMYASTGRPSIPPERLLKATLLMALYSVRSERLFCEAPGLQHPVSMVPGHEFGRGDVGSVEL